MPDLNFDLNFSLDCLRPPIKTDAITTQLYASFFYLTKISFYYYRCFVVVLFCFLKLKRLLWEIYFLSASQKKKIGKKSWYFCVLTVPSAYQDCYDVILTCPLARTNHNPLKVFTLQKEFVLQEQGGRAFPVALFTVFNMLLLNNNSELHLLCAFSKRPRIHVKSPLEGKIWAICCFLLQEKWQGREVRTCNSSWSNSLKVVSEHVHFDLKRRNEEVCRLPWSGSQLVSAVMWGCVSVSVYSLDVYIEFCFKPLVVFFNRRQR